MIPKLFMITLKALKKCTCKYNVYIECLVSTKAVNFRHCKSNLIVVVAGDKYPEIYVGILYFLNHGTAPKKYCLRFGQDHFYL